MISIDNDQFNHTEQKKNVFSFYKVQCIVNLQNVNDLFQQ